MKKIMLMFLLTVVTMSLLTAFAYSWGSATHVYIAKKLGNEIGYANLQEMYGSTLPDMVNLKNIPQKEPYESLYAKFHFIEEGSQEAIKKVAKRCFPKAFVYGFASHNDEWGADYTAHHNAVSIPGPDLGYVRGKIPGLIRDLNLVEELSDILIDAGVPLESAMCLAKALAPMLAEMGIETGVDILIKRNEDPGIGLKILLSASFRDGRIPYLLAKAYAKDYADREEVAKIIISSEREFRDMMKLYGKAFLLDEEDLINAIVTQWSPLVSKLAEELYIGIEMSEEILQELIILGIEVINEGILICEDDYSKEVSATIKAVRVKLKKNGFFTCPIR